MLKDVPSQNTMKTIFKNARIFTANANTADEHDCMIIDEDKIEYVGDGRDIRVQQLEVEGAKVHDVGGRLLAPGFIDG